MMGLVAVPSVPKFVTKIMMLHMPNGGHSSVTVEQKMTEVARYVISFVYVVCSVKLFFCCKYFRFISSAVS